jgi:hypothetical protein
MIAESYQPLSITLGRQRITLYMRYQNEHSQRILPMSCCYHDCSLLGQSFDRIGSRCSQLRLLVHSFGSSSIAFRVNHELDQNNNARLRSLCVTFLQHPKSDITVTVMATTSLNPDGMPLVIDPALLAQSHNQHHDHPLTTTTMSEFFKKTTNNDVNQTPMEDTLSIDEPFPNNGAPPRMSRVDETTTVFTPFIQAPRSNEPVFFAMSPYLKCLRDSNPAMLATTSVEIHTNDS